MKLLTRDVIAALPPLYAQEAKGDEAVAHVKFFDPCGSMTWFATEGSFVCPEHGNYDCVVCPKGKWRDFMFFGLVTGGDEDEVGYFSLRQFLTYKGPLGLGIERDLHWAARPLSLCRKVAA